MRKQSEFDPNRKSVLLNYDLEEFKNSIWENFLGSQVQIAKVVNIDGTSKITNQLVENMGLLNLDLNEDNIYRAWDEGRTFEQEGYKGVYGQRKFFTTWVCRPPNILIFNLKRI